MEFLIRGPYPLPPLNESFFKCKIPLHFFWQPSLYWENIITLGVCEHQLANCLIRVPSLSIHHQKPSPAANTGIVNQRVVEYFNSILLPGDVCSRHGTHSTHQACIGAWNKKAIYNSILYQSRLCYWKHFVRFNKIDFLKKLLQ